MTRKMEVLIQGKRHQHTMRKTNPRAPEMRFCTDPWCGQTERIVPVQKKMKRNL